MVRIMGGAFSTIVHNTSFITGRYLMTLITQNFNLGITILNEYEDKDSYCCILAYD